MNGKLKMQNESAMKFNQSVKQKTYEDELCTNCDSSQSIFNEDIIMR